MSTFYPNQQTTFTVSAFGPGGAPLTATLSDASLTVDGRTVAASVSGQTLLATLPAQTAPGAQTLAWSWHQTAGGVESDQTESVGITVSAPPDDPVFVSAPPSWCEAGQISVYS